MHEQKGISAFPHLEWRHNEGKLRNLKILNHQPEPQFNELVQNPPHANKAKN